MFQTWEHVFKNVFERVSQIFPEKEQLDTFFLALDSDMVSMEEVLFQTNKTYDTIYFMVSTKTKVINSFSFFLWMAI